MTDFVPIRLLPTATMRRMRLQPLIAEIFRSRGLLPSWGLAFAMVESAFRPWLGNFKGGDGRRGGAYGLFQVTLMTAHSLGFRGHPQTLYDPELNADLAAKLVHEIRYKRADIPNTLLDIACAYNSGKSFEKAPAATKLHDAHGYAKKVVHWQAVYERRGADA